MGEQPCKAVTRVKLEQASKAKSWMPTRYGNGEGSTSREETDTSIGSVHRGKEHGMPGRQTALERETQCRWSMVPTHRKGWRPALGVGQGHKSVEAG